MTIAAARSSSLWQDILAAPWVGPTSYRWPSRGGSHPDQPPQPLVDLIERALDEWPIEAVDAVLDEYFGEAGSEPCYEWQARQANKYVSPRTSRGCLLPRAPRPTGDEFFPEDYR